MVKFEARFACYDILILGKSPIKWREAVAVVVVVHVVVVVEVVVLVVKCRLLTSSWAERT